MKIFLDNTGKRFQRHWVFRDLSYSFTGPGQYAILGANGSGKSTLMRIIGAMQPPTTGKLEYHAQDQLLTHDKVFRLISYCAPGMDLVEELSLNEFLNFHFSFKTPIAGLTVSDIISLTGIKAEADRLIGEYSSGMKQRVKLAQAIFADTPVLLLDEPCTNLDQDGINQYLEWIERFAKNRLVIVASNDEREYSFCKESILMADYKTFNR